MIVIPAQNAASTAALEWVRRSSKTADITMSVCTGAFVLRSTGFLSGKSASTQHNAYGEFAMAFPDVRLRRGARFVEDSTVASAGGSTSGIDLALHVVERYYARDVEEDRRLHGVPGPGLARPEFQLDVRTRAGTRRRSRHLPVCSMDVDPASAPQSVYRGASYFFCMSGHKRLFDSAPPGG